MDNRPGKELYIEKGGKKLRCGYTTGSCAAAAAKAALIMLLTGDDIQCVSILTPKGAVYRAEVLDIRRRGGAVSGATGKDGGDDSDISDRSVSCAVRKDGGDDPDITDGALIYAEVRLRDSLPPAKIVINGGEGVGIVTKPGLDQPVGEAAINSVPRKMIEESLREVLEKYRAVKVMPAKRGTKNEVPDKYRASGVEVTISVPEGKALAEKTFNPRLGIVGGISILGTTGIVEPMSDGAIVETIRAEISMRRAEGRRVLVAAPGNYGITFLTREYGLDEELVVMSSNFVYETVRIAVEAGFREMLFAGHIGKLVKVAGGIKNTHSMYGDHRMEILAEICSEFVSGEDFETEICPEAVREAEFETLKSRLLDCAVTDEAVGIINEAGLGELVFPEMARRIKRHMEDFGDGKIRVEVIVFCGRNRDGYKELCRTEGAEELAGELAEELAGSCILAEN